jgi:hypothetical protein
MENSPATHPPLNFKALALLLSIGSISFVLVYSSVLVPVLESRRQGAIASGAFMVYVQMVAILKGRSSAALYSTWMVCSNQFVEHLAFGVIGHKERIVMSGKRTGVCPIGSSASF